MGLDNRKKSILATYHGGGYHKIGIADLRAVSTDLGCAITMKEFIFVDGVNVRKLIDDLGCLILLNVSKIPIPIHEICNAVELSN